MTATTMIVASEMSRASAFAAAALLISVAFSCCTGERWLRRRRPHDAAWTAAMLCFAFGAGAFFLATAVGWNSALFRVFYLFGGVLTVPVLALGTCYLLGSRRLADRLSLGVALIGAFAAGVIWTAPLKVPLSPDHLNEGREVFGVLPRVLAAVGSGAGAVVVIGGAVASALRLLRGGTAPGARRLAGANALIAAGTLIISAKGPFVALTGSDELGFACALALGLAVMFAGFLVAAAPATAAARRARAAAWRTASPPA